MATSDKKRLIYLYSWNPREQKIYEYTGYKLYNTLCSDPEDYSTWFCKCPRYEGQYWDNKVWFYKPLKSRAILIFIAHEHEAINELRDKIEKHNERIIFLSKLDEEERAKNDGQR